MAIRDVVVLNTTASRLETQQSTDTVRIKGSSSELLSVENSSGTSVLSINTSTPSVTITGNITASGTFSGNFPDTTDNATHYGVVTDSQNGTLEVTNTLTLNPQLRSRRSAIDFSTEMSVMENEENHEEDISVI